MKCILHLERVLFIEPIIKTSEYFCMLRYVNKVQHVVHFD